MCSYLISFSKENSNKEMTSFLNKQNDLDFLSGGGEMGNLIRNTDWSKTPLGHPQTWPQSLRTMVGVMLDNPFGMYIAWGKDYIQLYNDGYRPILGASKHPQALGISTRETFSEIWPIIEPMFDGVMDRKPVGFPDFMLPLNRNGFVEECYFDFSYSPIRLENGQVGGVLVTVIETTSKKKAEDALRESERRFRAMADNIPNLAWMANPDGGIFWYNKQWYDYTGTTEEQMHGWGWQSVHHPETLPKVMEKWVASIKTGLPFEMVFPIKGADCVYRDFLTRVLPIYDSNGNVEQWFGSNTDISEQVKTERALIESQENLRNTIIQAPVAMCLFKGPSHVVDLANERMVELWGKTSDQILNKPIFEGLPEAKNQGFESLLDHVFASGETYAAEAVPVNLPRKDGIETIFVNFVYAPFREAGGIIAGVLALATDVTAQVIARQQIEEVVAKRTKELAKANQSLQASNAELRQFAHIASHDLQEPVRKISTFMQMIEHSLPSIDERSHRYIDKINLSTERMQALIRDVLSYSQLGQPNELISLVDLQEVLNNIKNDFDLLIEQKEAVIQAEFLPVVEAIPIQMSQLFGNLVSNALKYARRGIPPRIAFDSRLLSDEEKGQLLGLITHEEFYIIECTDNGIGFNQKYADQIFEIFQRLHGKLEFGGTGIGLAICRKIVENHGGKIFAKGRLGQGSVFSVVLPVRQRREHKETTPTSLIEK